MQTALGADADQMFGKNGMKEDGFDVDGDGQIEDENFYGRSDSDTYEEGSPEARKSGTFFCLRNLFVTPVVVAAALVSGASQLGAAAELIENTADNSIETIQSKQGKREAAEEDMVDLRI